VQSGQPFEGRGVSHDEFDALVATHHGEIYTYLILVTGRVSDAHDLSQRTFLLALETRRSLGLGAFARLRLFGIATDLCQKCLRSRSSRSRACRPRVEDDGGASDCDAEHPVVLAMARLSAKQRMAFALRKIHEFDYEGVGHVLRCSSHSARVCVMKAFRKVSQVPPLRSALGSLPMTTVKE
jgi:DNA-directed RNA polymerase specialized sigma24 family protein